MKMKVKQIRRIKGMARIIEKQVPVLRSWSLDYHQMALSHLYFLRLSLKGDFYLQFKRTANFQNLVDK
jgi:hypothetical protein